MGKAAAGILGRVLLLSVACLLLSPKSAATQQLADRGGSRLAEVKDLYESAEYERALAAVKSADPALLSAGEARALGVYQALCFLALGRKSDAATKIEAVVRAEPLYQPSADLPNRLRALVDETRTRLRRELVQAHYTAGKQLFEAEKYDGAVHEFTVVLQLTEGPTGPLPEFADIRMLTTGFRDLGAKTIAASRPPLAPVPPLPPRSLAEPALVPPVTVRQNMPPVPGNLAAVRKRDQGLEELNGILEVVISPAGTVASAKLVKPVHPMYDGLLLSATKQWKYQPATRNGIPVEFVKTLAVNVR